MMMMIYFYAMCMNVRVLSARMYVHQLYVWCWQMPEEGIKFQNWSYRWLPPLGSWELVSGHLLLSGAGKVTGSKKQWIMGGRYGTQQNIEFGLRKQVDNIEFCFPEHRGGPGSCTERSKRQCSFSRRNQGDQLEIRARKIARLDPCSWKMGSGWGAAAGTDESGGLSAESGQWPWVGAINLQWRGADEGGSIVGVKPNHADAVMPMFSTRMTLKAAAIVTTFFNESSRTLEKLMIGLILETPHL